VGCRVFLCSPLMWCWWCAAGIYCQENSTIDISGQTRLERNKARNSGAALTASGSAKVTAMR
jgi:hypothetical protein